MSLQLILPKHLDKWAYRLRCRFRIEPYPSNGRLDAEKVNVAERFVSDMHKQGWEHAAGTPFAAFTLLGPFVPVRPTTIRVPRTLSAKQMLPYVANGARFLDQGGTTASLVTPLNESEYWEYEIVGVFIRTQILTEVPDAHEEERG